MTALFTSKDLAQRVETPVCGAPTPEVEDVTEEARKLPDFENHEQIFRISEPTSGLHAFIAIHDRSLGPALGGCRMWPYATETEAMTDALRLSHGMTLKAAMAGMAVGGGKSVIIGDYRTDKSETMFRAFGIALNMLQGKYVTGEDVGVSVQDVDWMKAESRFAVGGTEGGGGDPSPMTAYGVHTGVKVAVAHRLRRSNLAGLTVAVQGLGKVGYDLCRRLHADGARLIVADIDAKAVARAESEFGAVAVGTDEIVRANADVFAPCALGAVLNDETMPQLKAVVVAGSANNQLLEDRHGESLRSYGILYAPDYVINGGGLIAVAMEIAPGGYDDELVRRKTGNIGDTLAEIFARADREKVATNAVADRIAMERIADQKAQQPTAEPAS